MSEQATQPESATSEQWIEVSVAAKLLGMQVNHLKRDAPRYFVPRGLARKNTSTRKPFWEISSKADPRLTPHTAN